MKWLTRFREWRARKHLKKLKRMGVVFEKPEHDSRAWSKTYMASVRRRW